MILYQLTYFQIKQLNQCPSFQNRSHFSFKYYKRDIHTSAFSSPREQN